MSKRKAKATAEITDVIRLRGCLEINLHNAETGEVVHSVKRDNLVVHAGRRWALEKINATNNQTNAINAIAVGTSTTAPASNDTKLGSELTATVGRLTCGFDTTNLTSSTPNWMATVQFATDQATGTIGEAGLFNTSSATAGTLFSHVTFSTFSKATSNTLSVSYTISN
jgi:hypothetical protein